MSKNENGKERIMINAYKIVNIETFEEIMKRIQEGKQFIIKRAQNIQRRKDGKIEFNIELELEE